MPNQTKHLVSIGHMAVALQRPVSQVRSMLAEAGVTEPAMTLDLVEYYPGDVLGRLLCRTEGWSPDVLRSREIQTEATR